MGEPFDAAFWLPLRSGCGELLDGARFARLGCRAPFAPRVEGAAVIQLGSGVAVAFDHDDTVAISTNAVG